MANVGLPAVEQTDHEFYLGTIVDIALAVIHANHQAIPHPQIIDIYDTLCLM